MTGRQVVGRGAAADDGEKGRLMAGKGRPPRSHKGATDVVGRYERVNGRLYALANWTDSRHNRRRMRRFTGLPADATQAEIHRIGDLVLKQLVDEAEEVRAREEMRVKFAMADATLCELCEAFLDRMGSRDLKPSTKEAYRFDYRHIVGTRVGGMTAEELDEDPGALPDLYAEMRRAGFGDVVVKHVHTFVRVVLNDSYRRRLIAVNPIERVKSPKVRRKPVNSLPADELGRLLATLAAASPTPCTCAAMIACLTGMRRAEVCGLRWMDVDVRAGMVSVQRSISKGEDVPWEPSHPKTESSYRKIPVSQTLEAFLAQLRERQMSLRSAAGKQWDELLYVVGDPVTGEFTAPDMITKDWRPLARALNLMGTQGKVPSFHDLRHSFATNAIAQGMDVKVLSSILGHASAAMTLDVYADALEASKASAMDAFDRAVRASARASVPDQNVVPQARSLPTVW